MSALRPRALVHRGVLPASGVLLAAPPGREAQARARALALWAPGLRVHAVDGGLVVRFPAPVPLDAGSAPGHLLVEDGGVLLAGPLAPGERAWLAPAAGAVVVVRGGEAVTLVPGPALDPAAWLDLAPALVEVEPLGAPPPAPTPPEERPAPELRSALGVGAQAPEAARMLEALRAAAAPDGPRRPRGAGILAPLAVVAAALGVVLGGVPSLVSVLAGGAIGLALRRVLARLLGAAGRPSGRALPARAPPPPPRAPAQPGLLRRALVRLALATRFAQLAGLRQGRYLARMIAMFERGELGEALRHAIPLGQGTATDLALGLPSPRDSLAISPRVEAAGALLASGPDLHAELERLYLQAHQLLARAGRVDEAAFVLAELLHRDGEAVSFLERHGRLRLAAQLAEARGLPAGLVVRQWFLAGDAGRAVSLARAGRAFADAVSGLERSGRAREAEALRVIWGEDLAASGDLEGAVSVVRRVAVARALALGWTARAVEAGGPAGDALLATWLELDPARFPDVRARVLAACDEGGADGALRRAPVARGLLAAAPSAGARALARPVVRGVLRDAAGHGAGPELGRLVALAADGALDVDLPPQARPAPPAGPAALRLGAEDRGTRPVLDAAVLPGGRVLAALGEAGVVVLARDGRTVARLEAPAHRLVLSDAGTRALALAPRGEALRVTALDLAARTARSLGDLRLDACGTSFDGTGWVVAAGAELLVLDTLRDDLRTLWRVGGLPGPPGALERDPRSIRFAVAQDDGAAEIWRYELPGPVLRDRDRRTLAAEGAAPAGLRFAGDRWYAVVLLEGSARIRPAWGQGAAREVPGAGDLLAFAGGPAGLAAGFAQEGGAELVALLPGPLDPLATIALDGTRAVQLRIQGPQLTACDDLGRIVGVDLAARRVTHVVRC